MRRYTLLALVLCFLAPASTLAEEAPALRVTFLGTGAPRPSLDRYGPSVLVEAGDHRFLVDASWGLRQRLFQIGSFELLVGLDHVLLTHLHFDHTLGLPDLWLTGWLYGRRAAFRVEGPSGTAAMMENIRRTHDWDIRYRLLVGIPENGIEIEARDISPGVVLEDEDLKVTAFDVGHMPIDLETRELLDLEGQTLGYRIDYRGRSIVLSGDTRPSDTVVAHARGVDVLVHEVQVPSPEMTEEAKLANVSLSVHSTPEQVARIFARARPRMAIYSHIIPPDVTAAQLIEATRPLYDGPLTVAEDLMMVTIGDDIEISTRPLVEATKFERSKVLK